MPPRAPTSHFIKLWQTNKHAYAAVHRTADGGVVAAASTTEKGLRGEGGAAPRPDKETCAQLGALLAERAAAAGVPDAAWRRERGQRYHGRAAALLDSAKAAGLRLV